MHSYRFSLKPNQKLRTGFPGYQTDSGTPSLKSGTMWFREHPDPGRPGIFSAESTSHAAVFGVGF